MNLSAWNMAYCIVMFDLPTTSRRAKRDYIEFRRFLLQDGFQMLQWSVYSRHCRSREDLETHMKRVRRKLPREGEVRMLHMTDAQFARMETFRKRARTEADQPDGQLVFL